MRAELNGGRDIDADVLEAVKATIAEHHASLITQVSLSFACTNLFPVSSQAKQSGCMVAVFQKIGSFWKLISQTEEVRDTHNPKWVRSVDVQYNFELRESIRVEVHHTFSGQ